jgi:hypothetical protein
MAKKTTTQSVSAFRGGKKVSRPGRHSKNAQSKNKRGKNYSKPYAGQGR